MSIQRRTLRVCHVINALLGGGAEQVLVELARVAPQFDLEVTALSLKPVPEVAQARLLRQLGVELRSLDLPSRWDLRAFRRAQSVVSQLQPDVLHTHMKHADLVGAFVSRGLGLPMVSTLHLIEDEGGRIDRFLCWLAAQARIRTSSRTLTISDAQRRWYLASFAADPSDVMTLHHGIAPHTTLDRPRRAAIRADLGVPATSIMVTMVAMMRPGKGHAELIDAAERIPPSIEIHFVLAGDGPLRPKLEAAARNRCGGQVIFAGFRSDVGDLLDASDIITLPSLEEALSLALIEGLAASLPAVASDVGGIPEVVTPDCGLLVPPGDPEALAAALTTLAQDPGARRRLGAAALRRFEAKFEVHSWAGRLREVYEGAAAVTGPANINIGRRRGGIATAPAP